MHHRDVYLTSAFTSTRRILLNVFSSAMRLLDVSDEMLNRHILDVFKMFMI